MLLDTKQRRELARELSRIANASVDEILGIDETAVEVRARRIGITGPPGVGKSTLVGAFAKSLAAAGRAVGVRYSFRRPHASPRGPASLHLEC